MVDAILAILGLLLLLPVFARTALWRLPTRTAGSRRNRGATAQPQHKSGNAG